MTRPVATPPSRHRDATPPSLPVLAHALGMSNVRAQYAAVKADHACKVHGARFEHRFFLSVLLLLLPQAFDKVRGDASRTLACARARARTFIHASSDWGSEELKLEFW